ncbi:cation/H(+) antiporter 2-like [Euphorbia lathyris]|uniref:cation/H(+) antiporter 2-like n=1 Tax=Euphorbia lathyris TaxID=212925 RepID=UPI003313D647
MDASQYKRVICQNDSFNPLITTGMQAAIMLVISHIFHLILIPSGQPGPIANIIAGLVLGPSLLCRIKQLKEFFIMSSSLDYYQLLTFTFRVFFMFMIGLDADVPYIRRNLRLASTIAYGGMIICTFFGAASAVLILYLLRFQYNKWILIMAVPLVIANSASPIVIRLAAELKIDTANVGRLGITSSLVNEMSCVLIYCAYISVRSWTMFGHGIFSLFLILILIIVNKYLCSWFNKRNPNQKYVSNSEVLIVFLLVIGVAFVIESYGYLSTLACFFLGLMFPREGKTTRTLNRKLTYAVHNFMLPIYFGFIGFQFDVVYFTNLENVIMIGLMILLSTGGKIAGTLIACHYSKVPRNEGMILAFILNLKGHTELIMLELIPKFIAWWNRRLHSLVVIVVVLDTIIAGIVVVFMLRTHDDYFAHKNTSLESNDTESELRILSCVYNSRHISSTVGLISSMAGVNTTPITPYLIHLVELPKKHTKCKLMYHQLQDGDQFSDEEEYGGNDVLEINDVVDSFAIDTQILIHQSKVVSSYARMYEDVCSKAEDCRVSIILVHLYKHQRIDEMLETGKEGIRQSNQMVLRHAPCSVGMLVDRGHTGFKRPRPDSIQHVATLFFGGGDDREALAYSQRIVMHPYIKLTIIRFTSTSNEQLRTWDIDGCHKNDELLLSITDFEAENAKDDTSMHDFLNRYVKSFGVAYIEKNVNSEEQITTCLREFGETFSLIIVGKGKRGHCSILDGLNNWGECDPELGTLGDLLASPKLNIRSSVLVIQQHSKHMNKEVAT